MKGREKMAISLGDAIKNVRQDEKWVKKIIICGIIYLIMQVTSNLFTTPISKGNSPSIFSFLFLIISVVLGIWFIGFVFSSINKTSNSDKFQMVELSERNLLVTGLKVFFSMIGWGFLTMFVLLVVGIVYAIIIGVFGAIIFGILGALIGFENQILTVLITAFSFAGGCIAGLYFAQLINAAFALYFQRLSFRDLISYKKQLQIIMENKHTSWTLVGKSILYSLTYLAVMFVLLVTIIGIILIPFVIVYANFVGYNLIVQYAKEIQIGKYLQ